MREIRKSGSKRGAVIRPYSTQTTLSVDEWSSTHSLLSGTPGAVHCCLSLMTIKARDPLSPVKVRTNNVEDQQETILSLLRPMSRPAFLSQKEGLTVLPHKPESLNFAIVSRPISHISPIFLGPELLYPRRSGFGLVGIDISGDFYAVFAALVFMNFSICNRCTGVQ